ncbi:uncharacterized protein LOC123599721 [Leopardus geoffroyi]|uniref:uncharacterized protein LOC123599721 n=1 Tax=Leopardus geoffroyi TaxID=46844 RepID=UPI001E26166C|nr:uncharacterized protein LOC123599721 [Leopardus geoffroyi]
MGAGPRARSCCRSWAALGAVTAAPRDGLRAPGPARPAPLPPRWLAARGARAPAASWFVARGEGRASRPPRGGGLGPEGAGGLEPSCDITADTAVCSAPSGTGGDQSIAHSSSRRDDATGRPPPASPPIMPWVETPTRCPPHFSRSSAPTVLTPCLRSLTSVDQVTRCCRATRANPACVNLSSGFPGHPDRLASLLPPTSTGHPRGWHL